jgi:hypothetical protein
VNWEVPIAVFSMEGHVVSNRSRVVALGTLLLSCIVVVAVLGDDEKAGSWKSLAQSWHGTEGRVELFDWITDNDPAVHGHGDHIVGFDADDPNFKISDFDYDSPSERMIAGAKETRCPMCPGTDEYYKVERSFRSGRLAAKTTTDDRIAPQNEQERGRQRPQQEAKAFASDVDSPTKAMQDLLWKVIQDIRSDSESYAEVDAQRRKTAAEARRLERQRQGLQTEEIDVQKELERISSQQSDLIRTLSGSEQAVQEPLAESESEESQPVEQPAK